MPVRPTMNIKRVLICHSKPAALACAFAVGLTLTSAFAQEPGKGAGNAAEPGFFAAIGHWFDRQAANINSSFKKAGKGIENFGHEAGVAARTTVDNAKGAADAVTSLPKTRVASGHAQCQIAPNGAPDCLAAADSVCKAAGFQSGKSLDMTTAEVCPPKVYLAGRNSGPECHTETFVSRALCQ
jgi:hypothetical protein